MDSAEIFQSLGVGIKFDHKRFGRDIAIFKNGPAHSGSSEVADQKVEDAGPPVSKNVKRADKDTTKEGVEDEVQLFSVNGPKASEPSPFVDAAPEIHRKNPVEEAALVRKEQKIKVSGSDCPAPLRNFEQLRDGDVVDVDRVLRNMATAGFHKPTAIQSQAIPCLLAGRDLLAIAPTGSGKTLAFMVPILMLTRQLKKASPPAPPGVKALVLTPTRELTAQSARVLGLLLPGLGLRASILTKSTAARGDFDKVDVLLANPLRLVEAADPATAEELKRQIAETMKAKAERKRERIERWRQKKNKKKKKNGQEREDEEAKNNESEDDDDAAASDDEEEEGTTNVDNDDDEEHAEASTSSEDDAGPPSSSIKASSAKQPRLDLSQLRFLVLDEADKLFDLGFTPQIDAILAQATHPSVVRAFFSATLPETVETLAKSVMPDPLRITVGRRGGAAATVHQELKFVGREAGKPLALRQLLRSGRLRPPILVFVDSRDRARRVHSELRLEGLHAGLISADQSDAQREAAVASFRKGETWVLIATDLLGRGMDFPGVNAVVNYDCPRNTIDYVHRVGRTGRAGREGTAVTFFTEDDAGKLRALANVIKAAGSEVPEWIFSLEKEKKRRKKRPELESLEEDENAVGQDNRGNTRASALQKSKKKMPKSQPHLKPTARKTKSNLPRKLGSRKPLSGTSKKKKRGPTKH